MALTADETPTARTRQIVFCGIVLGVGIALMAAAALASQSWFDRHFIPVLFLPREQFVLGERIARVVLAITGLLVATFGFRAAARAARRHTTGELAAGAARIAFALVLAVLASEAILRLAPFRSTEEDPAGQEPLRLRDPQLGWKFAPAREVQVPVSGRRVSYAFDANGYRVSDLRHPTDFSRPTILFVGESIMMGYGLNWVESVPARVGSQLKTQSANLGVFAYADDQTFLRLAKELPRFAQPKAVVVLFMPGLVFRDFNTDRPYLGPGLALQPARRPWRLTQLLRFYVPYHSEADIDHTLALVRAELEADVRLARARGAAPLIVIPAYGPEEPFDRMVRRRVLDEPHLPYLRVQFKDDWRLPEDMHPNARGAAAIAAAVAHRLETDGVRASN